MMVGVITTFSTDLLSAKEIARDPARPICGSAFVLRFGLFVIGYVVGGARSSSFFTTRPIR